MNKTIDEREFWRVTIHEVEARHIEAHIEEFGEGPNLRARADSHREKAEQGRADLRWLAKNERARRCPAVSLPARPTTRARGAGRPKGQSSRSSARSGDSGSDSDPPEPPSPRLCLHCRGEIPSHRSPKATYCSDQHADRDRQRRKRARDHADPVVKPELRPLGAYKVHPEELEALRERPGCRCNGHHIPAEDGDGLWCFKCGHWRDIPAVSA